MACKIKNEIFPAGDARQNFIEQINKDPYRKEMDYYTVYNWDVPVGVTGIYSYHGYPETAWLGWLRILKNISIMAVVSITLMLILLNTEFSILIQCHNKK